jgi:hypothetical protein
VLLHRELRNFIKGAVFITGEPPGAKPPQLQLSVRIQF